jgi:hypothetical protein
MILDTDDGYYSSRFLNETRVKVDPEGLKGVVAYSTNGFTRVRVHILAATKIAIPRSMSFSRIRDSAVSQGC